MDKVLAGLPVTLTQSLDDGNGNVIPVQAISIRLLDKDGVELMAPTDLAFTPGQSSIDFEIPAQYNTAATGVPMDLRVAELICTLAGGAELRLTSNYAVRSLQPLAPGINSFQSMAHAQLNALGMTGLTMWSSVDEEKLANALIEAFNRIRINRFFVVVMHDDQSRESYGLYGNGFQGSLEQLNPASILALPDQFLRSLRFGQIAEADAILSGTDQDDDENLLLHSIGDTKKMFKQGVKIKTPLSRAAMRYLGRFLDSSIRIRR